MKLIIQIPCYNEAVSLPVTTAELPRSVPGVDVVEWLIIDDGSTDATAAVAKRVGVDHIVSHPRNKGLATAFMTGLKACIERGADIIVNTDADHQYSAECIPDLVRPILEGRAEMVVGARPIAETRHFSAPKKHLQRIGSWVVRAVSGTDVPDAPSGFRAISREAAQRLNIFSTYTYTLETIIQAGQKGIPVTSVPVKTNEDLRPSRLVKSIPSYVFHSAETITRIFAVYRPFAFFGLIGLVLLLFGGTIGLRFLYYYLFESGEGKIQSLILAGVLIGMGFQVIMLAFIADLMSVNRRLLEDLQLRDRTREAEKSDRSTEL